MQPIPMQIRGLVLATAALASAIATAQATLEAPAPAPAPVAVAPPAVVPAPEALPPLRYFGTVAGDELFNRIRAAPRFAQLSKELVGSPLLLRVSHSFEMTAGGKATGFTSAILAGSTLGLLPVVTNQDVVINYELVVNGVTLSTYTYRRNFTRSQNIFATDTTYGLGKEGLAWALGTADEFLAAVAGDARLAELVAEYRYYFPAAAPAAGG